MKVYTQHGQKRFDQVKPDSINDNTKSTIGVYNGRLDGQNVPVASIDNTKFIPCNVTSNNTADLYAFAWTGQTQDYYFIRRWQDLEETSDGIHKPLVFFNLLSDDWSSGWNNITEVDSTFSEFILNLNSQSGTLSGCFDINFRHGVDVQEVSGVIYNIGMEWWTRWGLFCNDVLIAESGRVYPRLESLSIPFSISVGTQPIKLELKWQTVSTEDRPAGSTTDVINNLEIYGASIWACNTKR
tara:strand:- start:1796 stop:2518 length:723 start_codon:yes stop_codon:yes gene_type:complete